eukprot:6455061-Amphidinium_carterae.1
MFSEWGIRLKILDGLSVQLARFALLKRAGTQQQCCCYGCCSRRREGLLACLVPDRTPAVMARLVAPGSWVLLPDHGSRVRWVSLDLSSALRCIALHRWAFGCLCASLPSGLLRSAPVEWFPLASRLGVTLSTCWPFGGNSFPRYRNCC